ncbi:MAG: cohesin domain-containing protein, partial [Candidatus Parcubacteria bacterium]|nr:cohesin domain-containing protein [Candidatus Parcubacteria bacterium]
MQQYRIYKNTAAKSFLLALSVIYFIVSPIFYPYSYAQNGETVEKKSTIFLSPRIETVLVGSTFDVSVFLDTQGNSINAVELNLKFPTDKLTIVKPSGGKSFVSIWIESPTYSNTEGTANFIGGVPEGINTGSGLITTITFKAKATGQAIVEVLPSSKVLANDGFGTNIIFGFGKGIYAIDPKMPEGVRVFSETHPFEDKWYNNNNPVLTWEKDTGITDYSFELDNKPLTVPDNTSDSSATIASYLDLPDGIFYFHIKAKKDGVWGSATHFLLHIDTTPPVSFKPIVEVLTAAIITRALISFSTTDLLSGIDHYEVGVIDKTSSPLESPVFTEAQSLYQLPNFINGDLRVIVRAMDRAGN